MHNSKLISEEGLTSKMDGGNIPSSGGLTVMSDFLRWAITPLLIFSGLVAVIWAQARWPLRLTIRRETNDLTPRLDPGAVFMEAQRLAKLKEKGGS